jgi:hypothetical protein
MAGSEGCVHTADDVAHLVAALSARAGTRVLLSHTPPRQRGPAHSDIGASGIHVGERALAEAVAAGRIHVLIHGLVSPVAPMADWDQGNLPLAESQTAVLAAGAVDPFAGAVQHAAPPRALVVAIHPDRMRWWAVPLAPGQ